MPLRRLGTKPFCDGTHKRNGFDACERVADPEWKTGPGGPGYRTTA